MTPHKVDSSSEPPTFLVEITRRFKKKEHVITRVNAITDTIKQQGGPLIPTSYFGCVVTSLSDGKERTEEDIVYLLSILGFVLEKLPVVILRLQFTFVSGVLKNVFEQCPESTAILVKLVHSLSLLLQAQDGTTLHQHQQDAMTCFHLLLSLSIDERHEVSRAAHIALLGLFKSATPSVRKLLSGPFTHFCNKTLSLLPAPSSEDAALQVLKLIKLVFAYLASNNIGTLCETVLRLPTLAIASITTAAFHSILGLLGPRNEDDTAVVLGAAQLVSLVEALIDMQPHFNDTRPLIEYAFVMSSLFSELVRVDADGCAQKLPTLFEHLVPNFASENGEITKATHDALATLIRNCISEKMIQQAIAAPKSPLLKIVGIIETSLSPQYHRSWDKSLLVIAILFEKLGVHSSAMLGTILATVGELYNTLTPQTHMPVFAVLGYAISSMGPKKFLEVLPLNLDSPETEGGINPNRAWLLPLLRSNIEQTELKFFVDYFLPLANRVSTLSKNAEQSGRLVEAKNKQIIHDQIWDLFPSFCDLPIDLAQCFKGIAKTLGSLLTDAPHLRKVLFSGLQKLIDKNVEMSAQTDSSPAVRVTPEMAKNGLKVMAVFSKNFLPIFFTLFGQLSGTERKDTLYNLITAYIKISDQPLVAQLFKSLMQKLLEASTEPKKEPGEDDDTMEDDEKEERRKEAVAAEKARRALIDTYSDLASAFVPALSIQDLDFLFRVIKPYFKSKSVHTQKRAYKVLRGMCSRDIFIKKFYEMVSELVNKSMSECSSAAKKQRIFVLDELLPHMPIEEVLAPTLIADIIFCSREINASARKVALQMLIKIAHRAQVADPESGLQNFVNLVVAGLAGTTPVMMSGSISALNTIVVEFKDVLDPAFIKELISTLSLLLQSKFVEVMTETVLFLKATMNLIEVEDLRSNLKALADGFAFMMHEHKGKFRDYGEPVVRTLIKKFGYDAIMILFPEDCNKVLRAINKREKQKKEKSKKEKESGSESSSESDSEFLGENLLGNSNSVYDKKAEPETFIIEDEEPVDFLDKKAMKRVISAKPQEKTEKQKKKSEFKMLPDGRLLIQDSDDDEDSHNIYFNKTTEKLPIDDRMMDSVDKEMFGNKSRRMTKKRMLENDRRIEDEVAEDDAAQVRPINEKFKKNNRATNQKDKKFAGHQFKAKKAGGDVKIGKLEPFAYIPLDLKNLNKRRRQQAVSQFKLVANASKHSAT